MNHGNISYAERLKAIVNKEQTLINGIIRHDYQKVKKILEKDFGVLTSKHLQLAEYVSGEKNLSEKESLNSSLIRTELNHLAEKNYAEFYVIKNNLVTENQTVALKDELSIDPPSHKEPLIYNISKGADINFLTKEGVDKKLHDLLISEVGGRRILEKDKETLIRFATIEAIKRDDLPAFKHLEREFNISENIKLNLSSGIELKEFIKQNSQKINTYVSALEQMGSESISEFKKITEETRSDNSLQNSVKLDTIKKTKELITAIQNLNKDKIIVALKEGADSKLVDYNKHVNFLSSKEQVFIAEAVKVGIAERNKLIPEHLKYKFDFAKTLDLQKAAIKGDALKAYNAIKNGADPSGITKNNYNHLDSDAKRAFENAILKAFNETCKLTQKSEVNQKRERPAGQLGLK